MKDFFFHRTWLSITLFVLVTLAFFVIFLDLSFIFTGYFLYQNIKSIESNQSQQPIIYQVNISEWHNFLSSNKSQFDQLGSSCSKTILIKKINHLCQFLESFNYYQPVISDLLNEFKTGQKKMVVLLQNAEELRSSGGFMGSYMVINFDNGQLTDTKIFDIYQADGQFTGFRQAPAGLHEYLSDGQGMRLPDSNWAGNFPTAAQDILYFLSYQEQNIDLLVAINSNLFKSVLSITGPINLKDYDTTINSDNFSEKLRSKRNDFYPGSYDKPNLLENFKTNFLLTIDNLSERQKLALINQIFRDIKNGEVLFFSLDSQLQNSFEKLNMTGNIFNQIESQQALLYPIESNVGINKANSKISRAMEVTTHDQLIFIKLSLENNHALLNSEGDYINYQRLLFSPELELQEIKLNSEIITDFDQEMLVSDDKSLQQVGFLWPVATGKISQVELAFKIVDDANELIILKQPGISSWPISVNTSSEQFEKYLKERLIIIQL